MIENPNVICNNCEYCKMLKASKDLLKDIRKTLTNSAPLYSLSFAPIAYKLSKRINEVLGDGKWQTINNGKDI